MKNKQELTLLFWHRKLKSDKKGFAPIYCRISIEGQAPEELSIGRKVHIDDWDIEYKKAKCGKDWKKINLEIKEVEVDLTHEFKVIQAGYELITPLMVKKMFIMGVRYNTNKIDSGKGELMKVSAL